MPMDVSVVMPCLNEADTVAVCVRKAQAAIAASGLSGEVIVADNGSTDDSISIAQALGARVVNAAQRGYGSALMAGMEAASGRWIIMGDADDSYDFSRIDDFVQKLREGFDVVMGNRFRGGIEPGAMPFLHRYLGNPVLSFLGRLFFRVPCGDFHCGLRALTKQAYESMRLSCPGMEFASEMLIRASLLRLRISEVPTTLRPDGRRRKPHLRTWRDGWRHLRLLLVYSPRWLFLYPGLAMCCVGLAVIVGLLPGNVALGPTRFGVHTMVYATALLGVGMQSLLFASVTRVFAMEQGWLSQTSRLDRWLARFRPDWGVGVAALFLLVGFAIGLSAVEFWAERGFGELDPVRMLRRVVPSAVALTLGTQMFFFSFFLLVLQTGQRRN